MKERLDVLVVSRGLAPSREKAKAIIMAGNVLVDGQREDKAGSMFKDTVEITVKGHTLPYVSRGGLKLEKAMTHFGVTLKDKVCMDVGASTGGFTDCMLQNGAVKVYSIDVGHGQLDWKLRNDERVVCMERTNIRYVVPEDIQELSAVYFDRCIVYFSDQSSSSGEKSADRRRRGRMSDQTAVRGGKRKSRQKRCGARSGSAPGGHRDGDRVCTEYFFCTVSSGIFPDQGTGGKY